MIPPPVTTASMSPSRMGESARQRLRLRKKTVQTASADGTQQPTTLLVGSDAVDPNRGYPLMDQENGSCFHYLLAVLIE